MSDQMTKNDLVLGLIVITSRRLLFVEESGMFTKSYSVKESVDLEHIRGVTAKGGFQNILVVNADRCGSSRTFYFYWVKDVNRTTLSKIGSANVSYIESQIRQQEFSDH